MRIFVDLAENSSARYGLEKKSASLGSAIFTNAGSFHCRCRGVDDVFNADRCEAWVDVIPISHREKRSDCASVYVGAIEKEICEVQSVWRLTRFKRARWVFRFSIHLLDGFLNGSSRQKR